MIDKSNPVTDNTMELSTEEVQEINKVSAVSAETAGTPDKSKSLKLKHKIKMPKWLKIMLICVLIAAIVIGIIVWRGMSGGSDAKAEYTTYTVSRGDVSVVITGSGTVAAIDQYDVTSLVKGEILSCNIEEGQQVQKDDVLYTVDSSDMESTISKAENSLEKAQMSYDDALEAAEKVSTVSPISGTITAVYVKEGETVSANGKVMDVINRNELLLTVPFIASDADSIFVGQSATVTMTDSYYTLYGTVTRVASGSSVSSEGVEIRSVEIKVTNPGALDQGMTATATIGNVACNSSGIFEYADTKTILAQSGGDVVYQPFKVGDTVSAGNVVMQVSADSANDALRSARLNLSDAQLTLQNARKQLEDYSIKAPISGQIIQRNSKAGDTLDNTSSQTVLCTIADMSKIVFEISVDELDITKISVGQAVFITADAYEGKAFDGVVDYVSSIGTTQNGVTSYPVKIEITNPDGLIPGMNVNAEIVVQEALDVIAVPVGAVNRGNTVYRKISDSSRKTTEKEGNTPIGEGMPGGSAETVDMPKGRNAVPDGYEVVKVEIGINDDTNIEITSGLSEGDIIIVPVTAESSGMNLMMPGMAGMGGGMPSGGMGGGMPSGGMSGGMPGGGMR